MWIDEKWTKKFDKMLKKRNWVLPNWGGHPILRYKHITVDLSTVFDVMSRWFDLLKASILKYSLRQHKVHLLFRIKKESKDCILWKKWPWRWREYQVNSVQNAIPKRNPAAWRLPAYNTNLWCWLWEKKCTDNPSNPWRNMRNFFLPLRM